MAYICGTCEKKYRWDTGLMRHMKAEKHDGRKPSNELPAFRVVCDDGDSYVTSMAKGITLHDAAEYFLGKTFTQSDEITRKTVVRVESI